jgi:pantoate kinase
VAFAPAAITNFFEIDYDSSRHPLGATGGGYILSKGTTTSATISRYGDGEIYTSVNGDSNYDARTTKRAVSMLFSETGYRPGRVRINQTVETPIGSGFGASGAAATSAVYAVASAAGIAKSKRQLALFAHGAEILEQTGLGTVSVVFDKTGAGAITVPGEPGKARFVTVEVPEGTRIVTASLAPYDKKDALSSKAVSERINRLGHQSLQSFLADPTLDTLAQEGERFSRSLGLESPEVKKLIATAKSAGADHASQNMIGYSIHSLVDSERSRRVARALGNFGRQVRVDVFEVGTRRAGVFAPSRRSRGP